MPARPRSPSSELDRAYAMHVAGVDTTADGRPAAGARLLRSALRLVGDPVAGPERARLTARLLISLAHAEAELGRTEHGLALLADAEPLAAPDDRGVLLQQRALLLMRTGRNREATAYYDQAVPLLADDRHGAVLAATLLNRSVLHMGAGRIAAARTDASRCAGLADRLDMPLLAAKAVHNLGYCELLAGDIPAALEAFSRASRGYDEHGEGFAPVLAVDRARALLAAGLAQDAGRELDAAIEAFRRQRLSQDHAEAELARASAALLAGDPPAARRWAGRAEARFHRRGNETWAALAQLTRLRAAGPVRGEAAVDARLAALAELAERLDKLGLGHDAELAEWLAVQTRLTAGREALGRPLPRPRAPLELRLVRRLAGAGLAAARGDRPAAYGQLRAGLAALAEHRARFGSLDLQAGSAVLGVELATAGLEAALADGSPRQVYTWSERARGQAFRLRPVRPPADRELAEAAAELRAARLQVREAELAGRREPAAQRRCAELERLIRERGWQVRGPGAARADASLPLVSAALAEHDRVLVSFSSREVGRTHRLVALVVRDGAARLVDLAGYDVLNEPIRRLVSDLDALAARRLPDRMAAVVRRSAAAQTAVLGAQLLRPLLPVIGEDAGLVLVPTRSLSAIPWGLLPELAGRAVTVAPSASVWHAAASRPVSTAGRPLLVAGPGLTHAEPEVAELASILPGARVLSGTASTVDAALAGLDGAGVAHFATHGHHDRENVLFSRLDLADGPLMAYDVQRLAAPPGLAVLSACDVGRSVVRPGDEILGFSAALLYAGTPAVVAGVSRVPDDAAVRVMTAFHRRLAAGAGPAQALADAGAVEPWTSFVCFGAG